MRTFIQQNPALLPRVEQAGLIAVLLTPVLLMHAHGFAEVSMVVTALCFLFRCGATGDWAWLRAGWVRIALLWWGWMVLCSLPIPALGLGGGGTNSLVQGLMAVRFPVFAAAMGLWVLNDPQRRRWLNGVMTAAVIYIAVHVVFQFIFGVSIYGVAPAWGVLLTGPFGSARAAPLMARILPPVLIPFAMRVKSRGGLGGLGVYAVLLGGVTIVAIVGQRIPVLLTGGALLIAAVLLPHLRRVALTAVVGMALLIASLTVISPKTYQHLVPDTQHHLRVFAAGPYGSMYIRALEIGRQRALTGIGFDGFRTGCPDPRYFHAPFAGAQPDGGGDSICWIHPHNFYLQALVDGGVPGLLLFAAMGVTMLVAVGRGLWRAPDPLRVGLFATLGAQLFPLQSTSSFWSMPMGGWFYFLLGWAVAEAAAQMNPDRQPR